MNDIVQTISSSASALSDYYCSITGNLANSATSGYKRHVSRFEQVLSTAEGADQTPDVVDVGGIDFSQGHFIQTGRQLDLALDGKGFFVIETPQGPLYTRNGVFRTNSQGQLVDAAGRMVAGESGPITIPGNASAANVSVAPDGTVSVHGQSLGKLKLVEFSPQDLANLAEAGGCNFRADGANPDQAKQTRVQQGSQEASNVNIAQELVELIKVSRLYEANMKNMTAQDDRLKNLLAVAMG